MWRSAEDEGAERKAKESAGEGRKVAEASRMRLEAAEGIVDAEEARGSEPGGSRAVAGWETRTHDVVITNHNFWESQRSRKM